MRQQKYVNAKVFILCYAVDYRSSFNQIREHWIPELNESYPYVPLVLVACKTDLRGDESEAHFVSRTEGGEEAKSIGGEICGDVCP